MALEIVAHLVGGPSRLDGGVKLHGSKALRIEANNGLEISFRESGKCCFRQLTVSPSEPSRLARYASPAEFSPHGGS
jgi:hypothetical protein